jgi:hypothetical protein
LSGWPIADVLQAPKVFISYSHADKPTVLALYHELKDQRAKLWLDQFELSPGTLFQEVIEGALRTSDAVLMVLSRNSVRSKWISFEGSFFYGQDAKKLIIPVVLDDEGRTLASELPFLQGRLYVDLSNAEARPRRRRQALIGTVRSTAWLTQRFKRSRIQLANNVVNWIPALFHGPSS